MAAVIKSLRWYLALYGLSRTAYVGTHLVEDVDYDVGGDN